LWDLHTLFIICLLCQSERLKYFPDTRKHFVNVSSICQFL
jgi:hypothetical protein